MTLLSISNLNVRISGLHILKDINMKVYENEIVVVVGPNGAGKSTLMKTIAGIYQAESGVIEFNSKQINLMPTHQIVSEGISLIPEGRQLFGEMTVLENLEMGAYLYRKDKIRMKNNIKKIFELFPVLAINRNRITKTFSGGEQQMISISRGLMSEPKLLMIDELSLGLAPKVINQLLETVKTLNENGLSVLLVEQNVRQALKIANRGYVFNNGSIVFKGTTEELKNDENIKADYLGF